MKPFDTFAQELNIKVRNIDAFLTDQMFRIVGKRTIDVVKNRVVSKGVDENGVPFSTPYSKDHANKRKRRGLNTSNKNFKFTGSMWDSFSIKETKKSNGKASMTLGMQGQNSDTRRTNQQIVNLSSDAEGRSIIAVSEDEFEAVVDEVFEAFKDYVYDI